MLCKNFWTKQDTPDPAEGDSVTRFFSVGFFHQIAPPGSIRGTLGGFRFFPKIYRDIQAKVGSAVYDTLWNRDSAVNNTLWNDDSAEYLTPWS